MPSSAAVMVITRLWPAAVGEGNVDVLPGHIGTEPGSIGRLAHGAVGDLLVGGAEPGHHLGVVGRVNRRQLLLGDHLLAAHQERELAAEPLVRDFWHSIGRSGAHDYVMKDNLARLGAAVRRELHEAEVRRARRLAEEENARL